MSKDLEISRLCDVYGTLLSDNMCAAIREYYDYDMSLAEIGDEFGITRQAVLCRLRQAEGKLREYESSIGLVRKTDRIQAELKELYELLEKSDSNEAKQRLERIITDIKEWNY